MILFSPGPSNISERVRQALLHPDIGHREPEFGALLREVTEGLRGAFGVPAEHAITLFGGSGSVGIESVVAAARGAGPLLVVSNGPYGQRAAAMARHHGTATQELRLDWGAAISPGAVERRRADDRAAVLYVVHHETATGRLNDLEALAAVAHRHGVMIAVDAVSSLGGEPLELAGWGLDAVIASGNKCLRGIPGVALVTASPRFLRAAQGVPALHYASLHAHATAQANGEFPFTPPVHALFALREALAELRDETVAARIAHYRALSDRLRAGLRTLGIEPVVPDRAAGHTIVCAPLPTGWDYARLHDALKAEGLVIYAAQGGLAATHFRVGLIGHYGIEAVERLLGAMGRLLA